MKQIGKVYQALEDNVSASARSCQLQALKVALDENSFRWYEWPAHGKLGIYDVDSRKVGELKDNRISVFDCSRLEDFLDGYDH